MHDHPSSADLVKLLHADCIPTSELRHALLVHFGSSELAPDENAEYFGRAADNLPDAFSFKLTFRDEEVTNLEMGPETSQHDMASIRAWIKANLLNHESDRVTRAVFFSQRPILGPWRHDDRIQLLPVPDGFPTMPTNVAWATYPFVVEVPFASSGDFLGVHQMRRSRAISQARLLLSLFLDGWLAPLPNGSRWHWVHRIIPGGLAVDYAQEGYLTPAPDEQEWFSDPRGIAALTIVQADEYFSRQYLAHGLPMDIPASLGALFDAYFGLDQTERDRFLRACYWLDHAHTVFSYSQSASYGAIIQAIETVMPAAENVQCCRCGRNIGKSSTTRFREFLDTYAPGSPDGDPVRRNLYKLRNKLAHGGAILLSDLHGGGLGSMDPQSADEFRRGLAARLLTRVALVNWLAEKGGIAQVQAPTTPSGPRRVMFFSSSSEKVL